MPDTFRLPSIAELNSCINQNKCTYFLSPEYSAQKHAACKLLDFCYKRNLVRVM